MSPDPSRSKERLKPTSVDVILAGLAPGLIMGMICCLVYFLIVIGYRGEYSVRLMYLLGLYTFASVLVARIAIEQTRTVAWGYSLALGAATLFVVHRFVQFPASLSFLSIPMTIGLLVLIAYLADRITFDCTLIDESDDSSGEGLLQSLGLVASPVTASDRVEKKVLSSIGPSKRRNVRHNPGVWVLYFSLLAIPLFGIGQLTIPTSDMASRRLAFWFLFGYLFFSMSLLVLTSFLGLRRYMRQRSLRMPLGMSSTWIALGMASVLVLLMLVAFLPMPNGSQGILDLPFRLGSSKSLQASRLGWGSEGVDSSPETGQETTGPEKNSPEGNIKRDGTQGDSDGNGKSQKADPSESSSNDKSPNQSEKSNHPQSDSQSKNQSEPSETRPANNRPDQPESSGKPDSSSKPESSRTPDPSDKNNSTDKNEPSNAEDQSSQKNDPKPGDAPTESDHVQPERKDPAENNSSPNNRNTNDPNSTPKSSLSNQLPSIQWSGLANLIRWIVMALLLLVVLYYVVRYRSDFLRALQDLINWWHGLWGRSNRPAIQSSSVQPAAMEAKAKRSFTEFTNPFQGNEANWTGKKIVQYSFEAIEAWADERSLHRQRDETPEEFLRRVSGNFPEQKEAWTRLTHLYNHFAYATSGIDLKEVNELSSLWEWLQRK